MEGITKHDIAKMIDHSLLHPTMDDQILREGIELAKKYQVASVCIKPYAVKMAAELLLGSDVMVSTVVGFPHGNSRVDVKVFETERAIDDGAEEIDLAGQLSLQAGIGKILDDELDLQGPFFGDIAYNNSVFLEALARRFEDAGADALTFHPRVAPDRRSRPPKWEYIGRVKQAVSIPVFGNGNVFDRADCLKMLLKTGCDGVAVGRMAIARPWLFAEWTAAYQSGDEIYLDCALRLAGLLEAHFDAPQALRRFKRFNYYYAASFKYGHTLSSAFQRAEDMISARNSVQQFFERPAETVARPNLNFFS